MRHLLLVLPLLALALGGCRPKCAACPTLPDRPVSEPPIVHVTPAQPEKPPCILPPRPVTAELRGAPTADGTQALVTLESLRDVAAFLIALSARMDAAELCLEMR